MASATAGPQRDCGGHRRGVSRVECRVDGAGPSAARAAGRWCADGADRAARRGRLRPADCLRQRREPDARARGRPPSRDVRAAGARRRPAPADASTPRRESRAGHRGRRWPACSSRGWASACCWLSRRSAGSLLRRAPLDWRVVGFTIAVSALTGLMFGIVPAFQASRANLNEGLRDGTRGTSGSRRAHRTRNVLVVVEVALAMVLLVGAVLLLQTFVRLLNVDAGFRPDGVLTMEVALPRTVPRSARGGLLRPRDDAPDRGARRPGCRRHLEPAAERHSRTFVRLRWRAAASAARAGDHRRLSRRHGCLLSRSWGCRSSRASCCRRRSSGDPPTDGSHQLDDGRDRVAGRGPVGRRIKLTSYDQEGPWFTVAGVVGDTRHTGLDSSLRPQVYVEQRVDPSQQMVVVLRASAAIRLGYVAVARAAVLGSGPQSAGGPHPAR